MASRFSAFINHPAGPKTVFFWAPAFKWGLVFANIADLRKPPQNVSTNQNIALAATGIIWARYSTQIYPINWSLFTVNVFVALTSAYQLYRKYDASVHPERYPTTTTTTTAASTSIATTTTASIEK